MTDGLAIIGNCSYSALLREGSVEWLCWPRPDSSFVFGPLLDREQGGAFAIEGVDATAVEQAYVENTNVLRTVWSGEDGSFELVDFAPRFQLYHRFFKPSMLVRILRPLSGEPRARIRCRPTYEYGLEDIGRWRASNHIEFTGFPTPVRLTTNVPLTYVEDERPFLLEHDRHLVLTWGEPLEAGLEETAERFLERTLDYWRRWVKGTRVPRDYQHEVVRSALALKLHQYEDTGALLAATTTSLPEHPGSGRNWDYRFCWLRDAYFTLNALERLGHSEEMEHFLEFLRNLCEERGGVLQPAYRINGDSSATERELEHLSGYNGDGPVRIGNQAFEHVQNDVYGEMVLGVSRLFLDARFVGQVARHTAVDMMDVLVSQIDSRLEEPDAGLWEFRGRTRLHSFSVLMHWAGARRAGEVADALEAPELAAHAREVEARARELLETRCWNEEIGAITQVAGEPQLDACAPARGAPRLLRARRPARVTPRRRDPLRALGRRRAAPPLRGAGRLRAHGGGVHRLHVLARRGARAHRPDGRGAHALRPAARPRQRPRALLGGHPPGHARAERELPADVLARRPHQRGVPALPPLGLTRSKDARQPRASQPLAAP